MRILEKNSIALHVRRGDFVNLKRTLENNYYVETIKTLENKILEKNYKIEDRQR